MAEMTDAEPEHSDEELATIADNLLDLCDEVTVLDIHVDSLHVAQLDEPWCDDSGEIRLMLDTDGGTSKANMITAVLGSDLPLTLDSTCDGHEQLTFKVSN